MLALFYRLLILLSRVVGPWSCDLLARGIAAGYFVFSPRRVAVSMRFYKALFPRRTRAYYLGCTWKQYRNFTSVYLDRILLDADGAVPFTSSGWEHIEAAIERNSGGVILMSHLGNWEIAAHLMKQKLERLPLALFMGARAKAQIERIQKEDLREKGIRIIAAEKNQGGTYDLLEALRFIQSGGLVSMTGDKVWNTGQRVVSATFLGHDIFLPESPHLLAMLSGAPTLYLLFPPDRQQAIPFFPVTADFCRTGPSFREGRRHPPFGAEVCGPARKKSSQESLRVVSFRALSRFESVLKAVQAVVSPSFSL